MKISSVETNPVLYTNMMKKAFFTLLLLIATVPDICQPVTVATAAKPLRYNYTYHMSNYIKKTILLLFNVRIYYVISASVNFSARKTDRGNIHFNFEDINGTGYKIRTFRNGEHLVLITADYDMGRNNRFIEGQVQYYIKKIPSWSKYLQRVKRHPFLITSSGEDVIQFSRDSVGIHHDFQNHMTLYNPDHMKTFNNSINIYKIMMETLKFYDHPFIPKGGSSELESYQQKTWESSNLNYTDRIVKIIQLLFTKKDLEPWGNFDQQGDFRLNYKISHWGDQSVQITGHAYPNEKVWRFIRLKKVQRTIKLRLPDYVLLEDSFVVDLLDKKGMGQFLETHLKLIE